MEDDQRGRVIQRDGGRCRYCGKQGQLDAHYIVAPQSGEYLSVNDDLFSDDDNLLTLCEECHAHAVAPLAGEKLLSGKEEEELRRILSDLAQPRRLLSGKEEEELKRTLGDLAQPQLSPGYSLPNPVERMQLRRRRQSLLDRQDALCALGRIRLTRRQQDVIDLCEHHLQEFPDSGAVQNLTPKRSASQSAVPA